MKHAYFVIPRYESEWRVSLSGVSPPTGPTYLHTFAKSIGFGNYQSGSCVDLSIHNGTELLEQIDESDLVCLTTTVSNYNQVLDFARKTKERGATVAIGGPWATVKAKQIAENQPQLDYIVRGEGESSLRKILLGQADKRVIKERNSPICTLPQIDFSGWTTNDLQIFQENYKEMLETGIYGEIPEDIPFFVFYQSSRGCIQKPRCGFCGSRLGDKYATRTDEQFYQDIEKIIEQISPTNERIHIFDCSDSFTTGIDRFEEYKSFPGVTLTAYARADEINPQRAKKLRKLGVNKVSIGIETGSTEMMREIGKNIMLTSHQEVARILKDNGISMYVNLIYGVPNETSSDIERTVDHFSELIQAGDIYRVAGRITTPLPNSRWYFNLLKKIRQTNSPLRNRIHNSDRIDLDEIQNLWLKEMTHLSMDDIIKTHSRLVDIAKQANISISSEHPRGIA